MFSYKAAVVAKKIGYTNIKIYNGGIKDWKKSGYPLESTNPLPEMKPPFIITDQFKTMIDKAEENQCIDPDGSPALTLLDFRTPDTGHSGTPATSIKTVCPIIYLQLDDLLKAETRRLIPEEDTVISITETGNRDFFVSRYLSKYGYKNIKGLKHGMRGWIKKGYPVE